MDLFKYNKIRMELMSTDKLHEEREIVRDKMVHGCKTIEEYEVCEKILKKFDDILYRRANEKYEKEHPNAKTVYHEHGWHLPEDDA